MAEKNMATEALRRACLDELHAQAFDQIEYICAGSTYESLDYAHEYNAMLHVQDELENYIFDSARTENDLGQLLKMLHAKNEEDETVFLKKAIHAFLGNVYYTAGCRKAAQAVVENLTANN